MRLPFLVVLGLTTALFGNAACSELAAVDRTKIPDDLFERPKPDAGGAGSSGGGAGGGAGSDADAGPEEDAGG
jgi:hypothetical protein